MSVSRRLVLKHAALLSAVCFMEIAAAHDDTESKSSSPVTHVVVIKDFVFSPKVVSVKPGDTITWVNEDIAPHTATAIDESWDTGEIKFGESASVEVTEGMEAQYFCVYHPMMKASIDQ